jgi:hypothetical protein
VSERRARATASRAAGSRCFSVSSPSFTFEQAVVDEDRDTVIVGIVESARPEPKRRVGIQRAAELQLAQPLGERAVVDARTRGTLPVAPDAL